MTSRARILCNSLLASVLLTTSSACRSQGRDGQSANSVAIAPKQDDVEAAVALLCKPADISRSKTGGISGCKSCPQGTDFFDQNMGDWYFGAATAGHFTSPHDDNLILDGSNCDSHASNFGGSFVFSITAGEPKLLKYDRSLRTDQCHKFSYTDGREFLVCKGGWSGQGEFDANFFLTKFDAAGKDSQTVVFRTRNTSDGCSVEGSDIKDVKFDSKGSGELASMTITATSGSMTCAQAKAKKASGKDAASMKTYEIQFLFDGKQFAVASASTAALRVFLQD